MNFRLTILGCGSSGGVPRVGTMWGNCDPENPKNYRRRCSALVERCEGGKRTSVLIDTSPDLREQLLSVRLDAVDGVVFTHDHADHTHGIDDLRMVAYAMKKRVDCYFDKATRKSLVERFAYCFAKQQGSSYPPILTACDINPGVAFEVPGAAGPVPVLPILQVHGDIASIGYRFGGLVYSPDVSDLPEESLPLLKDMDVWIVDALRHAPHPSHFHVKRALQWIERLKPRRAILTHMTTELDYEALKRELPPNVEPAYDGMTVKFN